VLAGVTPTAGGLVFTADLGGTMYAFDADDGRVRWQVWLSNKGGEVLAEEDGCVNGSCALAPPAPAPAGLGQMKRFASGRAAFQDFDWRQEDDGRRSFGGSDGEFDEDEGFVAHSAPVARV